MRRPAHLLFLLLLLSSPARPPSFFSSRRHIIIRARRFFQLPELICSPTQEDKSSDYIETGARHARARRAREAGGDGAI